MTGHFSRRSLHRRLYEIELYVVTGDLAGLDAGVYHFNPADVSQAFTAT